MKQLSLAIDLDRCIGCKTCVVACRNSHGIVDHENCMPGEIPYYLRVESKKKGVYPNLSETSWVVPCQHCRNAACIKACKAEAIVKDVETGIVRILPEGQWPATQMTLGTNSVVLQWAYDRHADRVIVCSAIDNLGKGAAGQAIQNANLMMGLPEATGLPVNGVAP